MLPQWPANTVAVPTSAFTGLLEKETSEEGILVGTIPGAGDKELERSNNTEI